MTNVSKHDAKEKRKSNHVKSSRVNFLVTRSAVGDYNFMKSVDKFIDLEVSGWCNLVVCDFIELYYPL